MSFIQAVRMGSNNQRALLVSASAFTGAIAALTCDHRNRSYSKASSDSLRDVCNLFTWDKVSPWIQHHSHLRHTNNELDNANISTPVILAASPILSATTADKKMQSNFRWMRFQWMILPPTSSDQSTKSTWLQRIGKTLFVITRGVEIVLRLSPLLILTPTAILVEYSNSMIERMRFANKNEILSTSCELRIDDDDNLMLRPFQEFEVARMRNEHRGTWAANLAWRYTLNTLQTLGPAFCKLGQWAATRRDLFPVYMCNRLSELHDMTDIHSLEYTRCTLQEAFGDYTGKGLTVGDVIGSGSAAQVYKGTLTLSTRNDIMTTKNVAIKVLHPNTRLLVERDLALMQNVADFIDTCIPLEMIKMLSLPRAVANFSDIMRRQVDLRIEGDNLRTFRSNFCCSDSYKTHIDFPQPQDGFISELVLVEDHIDAKPISFYLADDSQQGLLVRKQLAGPLLRAFLKMVFIDNFVHADLHPGNVLVHKSGNDHKIFFLDAGIAMSLDPRDKQNLHDLFKAVVLNDGYTAGILMVERARYERCTPIPGGKHAFASGVADIVSEFHDRSKQGLTLGAVRVGSLLGRVLDLCRRHGVEIDPAMASVVVSMLVLEGLGRSLDPDLNLMKAAMPFLLGKV